MNNCFRCSSLTKCEECLHKEKPQKVKLYGYDGGSETVCSECKEEDGVFIEKDFCLDCPNHCKRCESMDVCFECREKGMFLWPDQNTCKKVCPAMHRKDYQEKKCVPCDDKICKKNL